MKVKNETTKQQDVDELVCEFPLSALAAKIESPRARGKMRVDGTYFRQAGIAVEELRIRRLSALSEDDREQLIREATLIYEAVMFG